jgi:hypothetical protein
VKGVLCGDNYLERNKSPEMKSIVDTGYGSSESQEKDVEPIREDAKTLELRRKYRIPRLPPQQYQGTRDINMSNLNYNEYSNL